MDASKREQLERLYRGMTHEEIEAHEDWVRRYKAEQAEVERKIAAAAEERADKLRALPDAEAVEAALRDGAPDYGAYEPEEALLTLTAAGFVRNPPVYVQTSIILPGGRPVHLMGTKEQVEALRVELLRDVPGARWSKGA